MAKAALARKIGTIIERRGPTQSAAAKLLGGFVRLPTK
jgi:hypothetical protein